MLRLLPLALAACWTSIVVDPPPQSSAPSHVKRKPRTCARLETIAGELPKQPDLGERCGHYLIDEDRYYCSWGELAYYTMTLRWWIDRAQSACAEESRH